MATATAYQHIFIDDRGVPQVAGANTTVIEIVQLSRVIGDSAEAISDALPHLTPAQVHSALAYYWDHRDELDADIVRREAEADRLRSGMGQPPVVERLLRARRAQRA